MLAGVGVSHLAGSCECLSSCFQVVPKNTPHPKTFQLLPGYLSAPGALSRYSPTARNRLLFNLPNSRKDIFMQTMRTVCPDCGSEMFNQPDDFDFETNFTGVSCADCGREITKDDVVNQATDTVKKQLDDMLRNSSKELAGSSSNLKAPRSE
jgi:DNA-directed RNA polymerase subunit RPC12/RpoP